MEDNTASRLERSVNDFRVEMATAVATIVTRLDSMKDHDKRIRNLETGQRSIIERMDADDKVVIAKAEVLKDADEARRAADTSEWLSPARMVFILGFVIALIELFVRIT